jgi:hypothetical protein
VKDDLEVFDKYLIKIIYLKHIVINFLKNIYIFY